MGWLHDWLNEVEASRSPQPSLPIAKSAVPQKPKAQIKEAWFQMRSPRDGDLGAVGPGFYSVVDGYLMMHDEEGKPTGNGQRLSDGDDARMIASKLAKEAWQKTRGESDFNRPLYYLEYGVT